MELPRHRAALAYEKIFANRRRPWRQGMARRLPHKRRHAANLLEVQLYRHAIQSLKRHRNFANVAIARALAHSVDGSLYPLGAGAYSCHRARRRHAEIIVSMEMQWHFRPNPFADLPHQEFHGFRPTRAN